MNAPAEIDEIRVFLPDIGEREHALRAKMRSLRNVAARIIASSASDTARSLAWHASDYAVAWLYAPADEHELEDLNLLLARLLRTALHAADIDEFGPGEIPNGGGARG